ncbi:unnamed protein product [Rotaria sordida]|uniref:Uncharacterized protein n=1 Tax=Rotaria sordida TaxID=392033 RepID=A0A815PFS9_9BILA|nr:unnamed protein product [Rotaria sordida]CAF1448193.1 unnamed protein product [Rotaria sordida]
MKTQSSGAVKIKRTSSLINKCLFDDDYDEDTDDIQTKNQLDIDYEEHGEDSDDEDEIEIKDENTLEFIYENDFFYLLTGSAISRPKSKRIHRFLGALVGICVICTCVLAVILVGHKLCITQYCFKAASYLIATIDETVEPCEDFYHFACGRWIKNTQIPDNALTASLLKTQLNDNLIDILTPLPTNDATEPKAISNARVLYHSCINEENIEKEGIDSILLLINQEFGGWPILQGSSWNASTFNLFNLLLKLRQYSNDIIFSVDTSIDEKNSTEYEIVIGRSVLGLDKQQYYFNETKMTNAYQRFITDVAIALSNNTSMIEQDVKYIFEFEKEIAKYYWTTADQLGRQNPTIRTTVDNIPQLLNTTFNLTNYLRSAFSWAGIDILDSDIVTVDELDYFYNISLIIDQTPPRTLQNYVIWRFMMDQIHNMPKRFRSIEKDFDHIVRGTATEEARTVMCGNYVNDNMGFAVSKLYIKKYFDYNARNQSFEIVRNIRKAFINTLNESTWMDNISKSKAIEKAEAIDEKIGYPDYLASDNVTQLETEYAEYIFNSSYINNVLKLLQIKAKERFQILRKSVDRKAWNFIAPTVVNAFYLPSTNQITFPVGILQMPFFHKDAPKYLNYGGIGTIIGHEITHGFDNDGRQFDKDGNRIPSWTNETIEKFIQRKTCIVDQYRNYTIPEINIKANGFQTQNEDIADNGGLREAFFAYRKWAQANPNVDKRLPFLSKYSPEQMFFINFAHSLCSKVTNSLALNLVSSDVHSLGLLRVIGPTSNFVEFDRAFNCKPGQGNCRVNKCIVW